MGRKAWLVGVAVLVGLLGGCVERRMFINSDPPGALVLVDGKPIGATPVDYYFGYYGKYHFTIIKDGFKTAQIDQKVPFAWYQIIGLDFISENLVPFHIEDVRNFSYHLEPIPPADPAGIVRNGQQLRTKAQGIGPPPPPAPPPVADPSVNLQPPAPGMQPGPIQPQPTPAIQPGPFQPQVAPGNQPPRFQPQPAPMPQAPVGGTPY